MRPWPRARTPSGTARQALKVPRRLTSMLRHPLAGSTAQTGLMPVKAPAFHQQVNRTPVCARLVKRARHGGAAVISAATAAISARRDAAEG